MISICSTDDRYADDIHYMGGALLTDKISWGSTMFSLNAAPPDPASCGAAWRDMWKQRLKHSGFWLEDWLRHQRRDAFYKHGSVCENWDAITCPVYAVGGWADGYTNAIGRLLANLKGPRKGLIGPWAHKYPHFAKPGPQIGFLQECLRWWDHWLKGIDTGIMDEPMLRAWIEDPIRPSPYNAEKPGRWVAEKAWPGAGAAPRIVFVARAAGCARPGNSDNLLAADHGTRRRANGAPMASGPISRWTSGWKWAGRPSSTRNRSPKTSTCSGRRFFRSRCPAISRRRFLPPPCARSFPTAQRRASAMASSISRIVRATKTRRPSNRGRLVASR